MTEESGLFSALDSLIWMAHKGDLCCRINLSDDDWNRYFRETRKEARGYWHGATGRIFERLCAPQAEWNEMVRIRCPHTSSHLGDSSFDFSYLIVKNEEGG